MIVKTAELENYLTDASNLAGGRAEKLFVPETAEEVAEILRRANETKTPVTVSGARTGIVGGAVPFGGVIVSLEKLNEIKTIEKTADGGRAVCGAGVILADFQRAAEAAGLFYPPDPTEWSCQLGGTVATNASGARSFKYGATRRYVEALEVVLPTGEIIKIRRGEILADAHGNLRLPVSGDKVIELKLPTYAPPATRKNASGYFAGEQTDAVDLFVGSEGTLGVVTEIEFRLLPKPEAFFSGIVFFENETDLLNFVKEARELSFANRNTDSISIQNPKSKIQNPIDASLIEYFDDRALEFIRAKFDAVPANMAGAIFFEQETSAETEDAVFEAWNELLEKHHAAIESSWFAVTNGDREKMREFRHHLPLAVNEWIVRHKQRKVSTDISVPDAEFAQMLRFYRRSLQQSGLNYVIFGHIGDNHVHVNILPKDAAEAERARHLYGRFVAQSIMLGGTVSAEHGIGKIKSKYLYVMYGERYLNEMAQLKAAFDPAGILGRGNVFDAKYLS